MESPILAPSILAADFTRLGLDIKASVKGGAQWIHCDIMDGHFVPNISYGPIIVDAARRSTEVFLDVHLMIYNVDRFIPDYAKAGADLISIHIEAVPHIHRSIQLIKSLGLKAGVAINPGTSLSQLEAILPEIDLVVLMSVNPGFGGQSFIEHTFNRIEALSEMRTALNPNLLIEIDGGVGMKNAKKLVRLGADVLVAGSSVFKGGSAEQKTKELLQAAQRGKTILI